MIFDSGEYDLALFGLVTAVELFLLSIPCLGFYRLRVIFIFPTLDDLYL
jgi:hypothetical protein